MKGKEKNVLIIILVFAFIIRYLSLPSLFSGTFFNIDEVRYYKSALQLVQTGVFGFNSTAPNSFVTPGYIIFLAAIVNAVSILEGTKANYVLAIYWTQALLSLGIVTLSFLIAYKAANIKTAIIAAVLTSLYPPLIFANAKIMTEILFTFFFLLYVYLVQIYIGRRQWLAHAFTGVILATAALIRPTVVPVLALPYLICAFTNRQPVYWKGMLAALIAFSVFMTPWWVRNYQIYHKFIPFSTESGDPFLRGTDPYDPNNNHGEMLVTGVPEKDKLSLGIKRIKYGFKDNPIYWLKWFSVGKTAFLWSKPWGSVPAWGEFYIAKVIHLILIVILGWAGLIKSLLKPQLRWLAVLPIFFTLIQLFFLAIPRYIFQLTPIMLIFAAIMLTDTVSFIGKQINIKLNIT